MNLPDDIKLENILKNRAAVPVSKALEQRIMFAVKQSNKSEANLFAGLWIQSSNLFGSLSWAKTGYAFPGVLILGLALGFIEYTFMLDSEYQAIADLFYREGSLL